MNITLFFVLLSLFLVGSILAYKCGYYSHIYTLKGHIGDLIIFGFLTSVGIFAGTYATIIVTLKFRPSPDALTWVSLLFSVVTTFLVTRVERKRNLVAKK
jgi:hypothetical protein